MSAGDARCPRCGADAPADARFCSACGYATTRLSPGQVLDGKYEILDKIGEGGMGHVYRARHIHLDEIRIIKVTKPDPLGEGLEPRRFQEEARIATLVRHPNVAALYDFSRLPDGSFYMVWEFIDGVTLEQWLARHGAMPVGRALEVARQVLAGLAEIHAQGIVHRDLAPDNVMLREGPGGRLQAKIIDLGIAKRVAADSLPLTVSGMFVGKLKYCSPEQAGSLPRGETVDGRSDLYSFGVVLYEMLTGRPPFEAPSPEAYLGQHLHTPAPPLDTSRWPAPVGAPLAAIVKRALEKNRDRRFRDADEFRQTLASVETAVTAAGPSVAGPASPDRRPARSVRAAAALLLAAAAVAGYLWTQRRGASPGRRLAPTPERPAPTATAAATPSADAGSSPAPAAVEAGSSASRVSSRSVADPAEAGEARPRPTAPRKATPEPSPVPTEAPSRMDAEATQRFRKFLNRWRSLSPDRQAAQALALARSANLFVSSYPDDPLAGELRRALPRQFKDLALGELDQHRPRVGARFYAAYRALDFAPGDAGLDGRFEALPPRGRPPGP